MTSTPITFFNLVWLLFISCCQELHSPSQIATIVINSKLKQHHFTVELASSNHERRQGLMYRDSLPKNTGMVFLFRPPQEVNMWMKNTLIPLDMLFIYNNEIVNIKSNASPLSDDLIPSEHKIDMVIEIPAGTTKNYNIMVGDKVELR